MDTRLEALFATIRCSVSHEDVFNQAAMMIRAYAELAEYALHREWPRCPQSLGIGDPPEECICGLAEAQAKIERLLREI